MKIPYADAIEVATEDVLGWFEACETERDCRNLANGMKGIIESVAQSRTKWLSGPDAPIPDPMRARPSKDGVGLDKTPFTVRKEPRHPLYTFDCCWFCGVDILRAEIKRAVGKTISITKKNSNKRPSRPLRPRDNLDSSEPRGIARTVPA